MQRENIGRRVAIAMGPDTLTRRANDVAKLTEAQRFAYQGLANSRGDMTHQERLSLARTSVSEDMTIADLQTAARIHLRQTAPAFDAAEDKRARRAAKRRLIAERGGW